MARKKKLDVMSLYANRPTKQSNTTQGTSKTQEPNPALAQSIVNSVSTLNKGAGVIAGNGTQPVRANPALAQSIVNRVAEENPGIRMRSGAASTPGVRRKMEAAQTKELGNVETNRAAQNRQIRQTAIEKIRNSDLATTARNIAQNPVMWASDTFGSAVDSAASGVASTAATLTDFGANVNEFTRTGDPQRQRDLAAKMRNAATANAESAEQYRQKAVDTLGGTKSGALLTKFGVAASQQYIDALTGSALGAGLGLLRGSAAAGAYPTVSNVLGYTAPNTTGGSMTPMLVRSFGYGAQEAADEGFGEQGQVLGGLKSASLAYLTEKAFGGNPVYDVDAGFVNKLLGRVLNENSPLIKALASEPADIVYEGLEEVLEDLLDPLIDQGALWVTGDDRIQVDWPKAEELLEDFAIGSALSAASNFMSGNRETRELRQDLLSLDKGVDASINRLAQITGDNPEALRNIIAPAWQNEQRLINNLAAYYAGERGLTPADAASVAQSFATRFYSDLASAQQTTGQPVQQATQQTEQPTRQAAQEAAQQASTPTDAGIAPDAENAPSGVFNTAQDAQEAKPTQTVADIYANRATRQQNIDNAAQAADISSPTPVDAAASETNQPVSGVSEMDTHVADDSVTQEGQAVKPSTLEESIENFNRMSDEFGERLRQIQEESRTREIREDEVKWLEERGNWLNDEKQRIVGLQRQAQGVASKNRGTAENHIDNRDWGSMRKPSIKSFQFDHPELHKYYAQMAERLRYTIGIAMGGDIVVKTRNGGYINKAEVPDVIRGLVNSGATREQIMTACEHIINDEGQENYALAKRVEILLDKLLTNGSGFEKLYGNEGFARVEPNSEYIAQKAAIEGGSTEAEIRARQDAEADEFVRMVEGDEWVDALEGKQPNTTAADGRDMGEGSVSPEDSTGAAPAGFDPVSQWQMEADAYHPVNEAAAQTTMEERGRAPMDIPTTDRNGRQVSKLVSTLVNANITTNEAASALAEDARNGVFSAIPYTDDAAAQKAEEHIGKVGWDVAFGEYQSEVMSGKVSKDINMMGIALYNNAVNAGALADAMDVISLLTKGARTSAQSLQVLNMINKASPESQLYLAMRGLGTLVEDAQKRYGKRAENVSIDEALLQEYKDALMRGDEKGAEKVWNQVIRDVAQQIPSNFAERLNNWRYLSMLGNPRTHVRNFAGNLGFAPVRVVSNMISTGIQSVVLDKANRRRAFMNFAKEENQARFKEAWKYYGKAMDSSKGGGKYSDAMNELDAARTIFKPKALEAIRKGNSKALDVEDQWFSQPAFAYALSSYMAAHNIPADALNAQTMSADLAKGVEYAVNQAEKATYRDSNAFSDWVTKAGENNKVTRELKSAALPFKRTPANILVRGVEYSPVGLVKGLSYDLAQVKKGNMTAAEAIDNISSGLTGTGLLALGVYLASQGLITASGDPEDEDQNWFNDLMGYQTYALNVGDKSVTIDWLAPEVMPLFVGVELQKAFADKKMTLSESLSAIGNLTTPMVETSMLSSVDDLLDAINSDSPMPTLTTLAASYIGQYLPTIAGQLERTIEKQRYETYRYNDTGFLGLSPSAQNQLGKMLNKVPGVEFGQIPYIDAWGREEESGNIGTRIWNNFFNPAYVNDIQRGKVEEELQRLHDEGYTGVLPDRPAQSTKIQQLGGEHMTKEEYVQYARTQGGESLKMISGFLDSDYYDTLTDDQRNEVIHEIYSLAKDEAKRTVVEGRDIEYSSSYDKYQNIEDPALYMAMRESLKQLRNSNGTDSEAFDAVYSQWKGLSQAEKKKYTEGIDGEFSGIDTLKKLDACIRGGMSTEQFFKAKNVHDDIDDLDLKAAEKRARFANWLDTQSRFTTAEKRTALANFPYTTTLVADEGNYEKMTEAGVSKDGGLALFNAMQKLEPAEGYTDVAGWQKNEAITSSGLTDEEQLAALSVYATDSAYDYYQTAYDYGIAPSKWSEVLANMRGYEGELKSDGKTYNSGALSQENLLRAMQDAGVSDQKQRAMYATYAAKKGWTTGYDDARGNINWRYYGY